MTDIENITPAQRAALEADGWVEASSLQMADGLRIFLRHDNGGERIVNVVEPGVAQMDEYTPPGADVDQDNARVQAERPIPDVIRTDCFEDLMASGWRYTPKAHFVAGLGYVMSLCIGRGGQMHCRTITLTALRPPAGITEVVA